MNIIIGKRIPIGAAVGGVITLLAYAWNLTHPDAPLPSDVVLAVNTVVVAIVQTVVVNTMGVTTE